MPLNYQSPGVYVEEVSSGARPIESAATAILAMIGLCREQVAVQRPDGTTAMTPTPAEPILVTNWTQFVGTYGNFDQAVPGGYLHDAMYGYFLNGGTTAYVVGIPVQFKESVEPRQPLLPSAEAVLLNAAGQPTLRLTARTAPGEAVTVEVQKPEGEATEGTFNLVIRRGSDEPKVVPNLTLARGGRQRNVVEVLTRETDNLLTAEILQAPGAPAERVPAVGAAVALAPAPAAPSAPAPAAAGPVADVKPGTVLDLFRGDVAARTGIAGLEAVEEVTIVACPDVVAAHQWGVASDDDVRAVQTALLNHCEAMKDRFAILDAPLGLSAQAARAWRREKMNFDSKYGALYYPWVKVDGKVMPPSGHVAGVYARVDADRGVFKAPANEVVRGAIGLERNITRGEQDILNPIGVNCIRAFPGQGIRIWGARTLSSDAQWRYVPVRRLFCNIEESILQSTNWIVFEPNDEFLWRQIKRDITAYLTVQWRSGALFGRTPEEAFFVKCDEETNPKELRDLGYCIVEVGLAPVKPAEFVVFRISQKEDGAGAASE